MMGSQSYSDEIDSNSIAIVGLSCRFPGEARDEKGFWELISNGRSAYTEASDRWNVDSFHHASRGRLNTSVTRGGHFVEQDISLFDAAFFKISPHEAAALDPQQRFMLELSYEALENAGISMEQVSGSLTGCFVGSFTMDWRDALSKDVEGAPKHAYVGTGVEFLSNRVSWFFNMFGPSMTLNTACSSSLVALHMACQSLRTGDSNMALAAGVNLLINPDFFLYASNQRFLAQDGKCKTFDASGDGYGRGEGCGVVVLKRIEDAIRDGDEIRAVIRGTGSNQDGKTRSITRPCPTAQATLIRSVYKQAGLGMGETPYFEAHGTGTKAGDPVELQAIGETIGASQSEGRKVIVGSVKPNVGHLESAAGVAGLIKAVLAVEKGVIPPNIYFNTPNTNIPFDDWRITVPTSPTPWPEGTVRRISINSFGAGGTNAHAVIDGAEDYLARRTKYLLNGTSKLTEGLLKRKRIFMLRADDQDGIARQKLALLSHIQQQRDRLQGHEEDQYLLKLAFTLSSRRSGLPWASYAIGSSFEEMLRSLDDSAVLSRRSAPNTKPLFVFAGQGAQWARMGVELMQHPAFSESIRSADRYLSETLGCSWSVIGELEKDTTKSLINHAAFSQALSTILQVALVQLLASWNITPSAVVGHSSGEIAAAYCTGAIAREQAWKLAYFKGQTLQFLHKLGPKAGGAMLAAGTSEAKGLELISKVKHGKAVVACINSPASITFSGDKSAIEEIQLMLQEEKIFERMLRVDHAYHSHHMDAISDIFRGMIQDIHPQPTTGSIKMYSSVSGTILQPVQLSPDYWIRNMVSPVRFSEATQEMIKSSTDGTSAPLFVEIGPHSTLQGPVKQILKQSEINDSTYLSVLSRGKDSLDTALSCAAQLVTAGLPVDLTRVNRDDSPALIKLRRPLTDLPSYAWNHSRSFWKESRLSKEYRMRPQAKMDLLPPPMPSLGPNDHIWRGFLRESEEPWILDHKIQGSVIYPAAGFISMAVEAARQVSEASRNAKTYRIRNFEISNAAVIPDKSELEAIVHLRPEGEATPTTSCWWSFTISTCVDGEAIRQNCHGLLQLEYHSSEGSIMAEECLRQTTMLTAKTGHILGRCVKKQDVCAFYSRLNGLGLQYGPTFRGVTGIESGPNISSCIVTIPNSGSSFTPPKGQRSHIVHPSTLDAILHSILAGTTSDSRLSQTGMVPTKIEEIIIESSIPYISEEQLKVVSQAKQYGFRGMRSDAHTFDLNLETPYLSLNGVFWNSIDSSAATSETKIAKKISFRSNWEPSLVHSSQGDLQKWLEGLDAQEQLSKFLDLFANQQTNTSVLEILNPIDQHPTACELASLHDSPPQLQCTVVCPSENTASTLRDGLQTSAPWIDVQTVDSYTQVNGDEEKGHHAAVVIHRQPLHDEWIALVDKIGKHGHSVWSVHVNSNGSLSVSFIPLPVLLPAASGHEKNGHDWDVLIFEATTDTEMHLFAGVLASELENHHFTPRRVAWSDQLPNATGKKCIFLMDHSSPILQNLDETSFQGLKRMLLTASDITWISPKGVPATGLVLGLSRVVRNEVRGSSFRTIQVDSNPSSLSSKDAQQLVNIIFTETRDNEFLLQDGLVQISRVWEDKKLNSAIDEVQKGITALRAIKDVSTCVKLGVQTPGMLSTLRFEPDMSLEGGLGDDEIEITVKASGINFRDVLTAMSEIPDDYIGLEAAGTVTRAGKLTKRLKVGDRVCCLGSGAHKTILRAPEAFCQAIPDSLSFEEAASLPVVFCTAYHALVDLARAEAGQSVLIHAAAGGVGQSAIQVAKHLGLEIFVTVGSTEKRESTKSLYDIPDDHIFNSRDTSFAKAVMRMTNGRGVDCVLNSLSGEMLRQTWNCLAPFGTFVEIGLKDILNNSNLEMRPFSKNATFCFFNLKSMEKLNPRKLESLMARTFDLIRQKVLLPVTPVVPYPVSEVESAFRLMQAGKHRGKMVLSFGPQHIVPMLQTGDGIIRLQADATYVLVGGLGGLGRSLSTLLVDNGARNICFLSRSGASSPAAQDIITNLECRGVNVKVISSDVADENSLQTALKTCATEMPPIKGVIHGAMVLRDTLFEKMSHSQWVESLRPKVQGTANLDKHLPKDLDFFIILSSFSGIFGNRGQSNYAAGCAFQDTIAEKRRRMGLKAMSIGLGIMRDVGVLAEKDIPKSIIPWVEPFGIREKEFHLLMKLAIETQCSSDWQSRGAQIITGLATGDSSYRSGVSPYYLKDARFSRIAVRTETEDNATSSAEKSFAIQLAKAETLAQASKIVGTTMLEHLTKLLQISSSEIDCSRPLFTYGVDSLVAMEMRNWIASKFRSELALFEILSHIPITQLIEKITRGSKLLSQNVDTAAS